MLQRICWGLAASGGVLFVAGLAIGSAQLWQPAAVAMCVGTAVGLRGVPALRGYQFTAWIVTAVVTAMIYPTLLAGLNPDDPAKPRNKWIMLLTVQAVMFGMGTQMSLKDFAGVVRMPWAVMVGIVCQFTIMPLVGYSLTKLFDFPDEIAAGVVLIGSCSSGLASNVMAYLAGANLALSIALTSLATLIAPLMTPLWMKLLAGTTVENVTYVGMMMQIIKLVIVPIGAALLHDYLKGASRTGWIVVIAAAVTGTVWLAFLLAGGWDIVTKTFSGTQLTAVGMIGFLLGAAIVGLGYHELTKWLSWLDRSMPVASMIGIVYYTAVTTAVGRNDLLVIGGTLFLAAVLHNGAGYFLGYWLSRALGLDRTSARTVALEVGLQNGGMATGLATNMNKLATVGLAAAVFSPWMNVSGSMLANYWRKRPAIDQQRTTSVEDPGVID
jgi:BASS family bile acid:Na+ symporter